MAIFIDDIIIVTEAKKRHNEVVEKVLKQLEKNNLFVKPEKCQQKVKKVKFLGVVIGPKRVEIQKVKVKEVLNWLILRNIKEMQKFLELANYYRQFIKDFAKLAVLLYVLVRKEKKWKWRRKQKKTFTKLKEVFMTKLVLEIPDLNKEI